MAMRANSSGRCSSAGEAPKVHAGMSGPKGATPHSRINSNTSDRAANIPAAVSFFQGISGAGTPPAPLAENAAEHPGAASGSGVMSMAFSAASIDAVDESS